MHLWADITNNSSFIFYGYNGYRKMALELFLLFAIFFTLIYWFLAKSYKYWEIRNVPFLKPIPIFGNVLSGVLMQLSMGEIFSEIYNKATCPLIGFFILNKPCLLIREPELIKQILIGDFQHFHDRNVFSNTKYDPISAHILFILKNPKWREIRTKISPVFTSSKIKSMSRLVEESGHKLVKYIDKELESGGNVLEMKEVCARFTVDVIASTSFGVNASCLEKEDSQFYMIAKKLFDWNDLKRTFQMRCHFFAPRLVELFGMKFLNPVCTDFLKKTFWEIMNERSTSKIVRNDIIDMLLEMGNDPSSFENFEEVVLVAQTVQFFAAGFETSSSTISFTLYEIACNPEIQNKLRAEIDRVSLGHDGISYDTIQEMNYLDMCVKEALRKYPPIPFIDRKCNFYKLPNSDIKIDKGTPIFISTLGLHYDTMFFPEPEKFLPERFSGMENKNCNFTYLPFGAGPRGCIGERFGMLTVKMGIACILKEFTVNVCAETPKKIKFKPKGMVLSAVSGIKLELKRVWKIGE